MNIITNRKKSRKLLFQELYAMSINDFNSSLFRESFFSDVFTYEPDEKYINEMEKIIRYYEPFFVNILQKYSPKFNVKTMSLSYILPIYIGLAEMFFYSEEIPAKVSINEAVEVAKVYGDDSSKKIVNGVLNKVYEDYEELNKVKLNDYSSINETCFKKLI